MDIVGAINHNLNLAGVKYSEREVRLPNGALAIEVSMTLPTSGRPTRLRAVVPYAAFQTEEVGGKVGRKFKAVAKKVAKAKVVKALVKVAKPLAKMIPGGAALMAGTSLIKASAKLVKSAKAGNKKAAKALTAPLVFKSTASAGKPKPKPAPKPAARPAPKPQQQQLQSGDYESLDTAPNPAEEAAPGYLQDAGDATDGGDGGEDAGDAGEEDAGDE